MYDDLIIYYLRLLSLLLNKYIKIYEMNVRYVRIDGLRLDT